MFVETDNRYGKDNNVNASMDQSNCKSAVTEHEKERIYRTTHVKNENIFSQEM
jgi:hypothetical protein